MTTPYETIYATIQDELHRGDLEAEINRRIQRAVQFHHRAEQWKRDLVEQMYVFDQPGTIAPTQSSVPGSDALYLQSIPSGNQLYVQQVDVRQLTRPRFFLYFKKYITVNAWGLSVIDPDTGRVGTTAGGDIEEASPNSMTDAYGYNRTDVYYRSGEYIKINSSTPLDRIYLGYFSDPLIDPVTLLNDWISTEYPALISCEVSFRMLGNMGKDAEQKAMGMQLQREVAQIFANNVRVTGK